MNLNFDYFKIIITIILAVIGWIIGHHYTKKRDKNIKKREITTKYLIEVYQILVNDISHRKGGRRII